MNVLVLGSGGREHAIAWKLAQSSILTRLYIAPGNAGTREVGENVELNILDFKAVAAFCLEKSVTIVVVGPEAPLVEGIVDYFEGDAKLKGITVIGPTKSGARLEGSKEFAKQFMERHNNKAPDDWSGYRNIDEKDPDPSMSFMHNEEGMDDDEDDEEREQESD